MVRALTTSGKPVPKDLRAIANSIKEEKKKGLVVCCIPLLLHLKPYSCVVSPYVLYPPVTPPETHHAPHQSMYP